MNQKFADVSFSDREIELIRRVAQERGITEEEAANELVHEGIAQRFKQRLGRVPAQIYSMKARKP